MNQHLKNIINNQFFSLYILTIFGKKIVFRVISGSLDFCQRVHSLMYTASWCSGLCQTSFVGSQKGVNPIEEGVKGVKVVRRLDVLRFRDTPRTSKFKSLTQSLLI